MSIADLIAALEAADGPNRELDGEIVNVAKSAALAGSASVGYFPYFTSSVDAALTLVPDGAIWRVGRYTVPDGELGHAYSARVDGPRYYDHGTAAIALCIAALRAREDKQ